MKFKREITFLLCLFITLNLFSQQYTEQTAITITGVDQGASAWGDYNSDGYLDFVLTGWDGTASVPVSKIYRNNGNNTFTEQSSIVLPGVQYSSVAWGDYDNDGDLDLLLTGTTTGVTAGAITRIYKNTAGVFTDISASLPGIYFGSVSWCDYDRDGRLDVLLSGMNTSAERITKIYRNKGNGIFSEVIGTPFIAIMNGSVVWGDYDNDGYPDLLVTGQDATINRFAKVYHNNGDGTFDELKNISLKGVFYSSAAWGDFNGDGLLDILYSGEDADFNSITVLYQNMGKGSFTELSSLSLPGVKKGSVAWGDYDDDGKLDIFLAGISSTGVIAQVYKNCSNSIFCSTSESITELSLSSLGLADYDNDGDLDLLITGQDQSDNIVSKIYRNSSPAVNNIPAAPSGLSYTTSGTTAILKWSGVTTDETPSKTISYNVRMGRSASTQAYVSPQASSAGFRRIPSYGNSFLDTAFIFKNLRWDTTYYASVQAIDNSFRGSGFTSAINIKITPVQPTGLFASYITTTSILVKWQRGNGDRCIVFVKEGSTGNAVPVNNTTYFANSVFKDGSPIGSTGWYCVYKGVSDSVLVTGLDTQKDYSFHVIEFQRDNGSELYAAAIVQNIGVFSTGLFTNQAGISMVGLRRSAVAWGDFNNDGYLDALIAGQTVAGQGTTKIYQNNANNTFTELTGTSIASVYFGTVDWGDYDNDGFLDILVTGYNSSLAAAISRVYKNNGNSTFTEQTDIALSGVYNSAAAWGDYDNDGDLDIMLSGLNMDIGPVTKIYRNDGSNIFTDQTGISVIGVHSGTVSMGDYDNDGFLDFLLTGFDADYNRISRVYRNTGNNNFVQQTSISLPGISLSSCSWGDIDNDGNLDILLAGATGEYPTFDPLTKIYHNNGDGSFTELTNMNLLPVSDCYLAFGDYNNDGFLDILMTGNSGTAYVFKVYHNNGNKTFTDNPYVQLPGAVACGVEWADYDNDGDLDILFSGYTGALLSRVYKNNTFMNAGNIKPNLKPASPSGLTSVITSGNVKLSWSLITNDETPTKNMSYNVRCRLKGESNWDYAPQSLDNGSRNLAMLGNVQLNRTFNVKNPVSGTYYWQIQAVDWGFAGSTWSKVDSFMVKNTQAYFRTDTVCLGLPTHFTDQSVVFDGIVSWKWDFKDGVTSTQQNPTHTYLSSGTYNVKLLVTSNKGDKDSLQQDVIVKAKPKPGFTAPNACIGTATVFTNTTTLNSLTSSGWNWDYGDEQSSTIAQPGNHTYGLKGTYKAKLKVYTTNGCADSLIKDVIVAVYPSSTISLDGKLSFCAGDSVKLAVESDPNYSYVWRLDNNDLTNTNSNTFKVTQFSGTYTARITNNLANCVTHSEQKIAIINPKPSTPKITSANYTEGNCVGENPIKLTVDQAVTGYNYQWYRNESIISDGTSYFIGGFLKEGSYAVEANLNGCIARSNVFSVSSKDAPAKPEIYAQGPTVWILVCSDRNASKYNWYYNNNIIPGAGSYTYVAGSNLGNYFVRIGKNDCFTSSDVISIPSGTTDVEILDPFEDLKIFPNPSGGLFNLEMNNPIFGDLYITVVTQGGKQIMKTRLEKTTSYFSNQVDLSGQAKGLYFINLKIDKFSSNKKIIIE